MAKYKALADIPCPHLSAHIISPGGYGKTTVLSTLPKPLLIADCDGGTESLFKDSVVAPSFRGGIHATRPTSYQDALEIVTSMWKEKPDGERQFAAVAFDSFSSLMNRIVKPEILAMSRREKMEMQDWGLYLERGLSIAIKMHDLAVREDGCHTVLTFHEADKGGEDDQIGKIGPAVHGQMFDILPGLPNYVFFMRIRRLAQKNEKGVVTGTQLVRQLQTEADARTPAKSRRQLDMYEPPDLGAIWEKVRPML